VTVSEFRQSPPVRTGTVTGSYLTLADCVLTDVARPQEYEGVRYQLRNAPGGKSASIVGLVWLPGGLFYTVPAPVLEVSFSQGDGDKVTMETRTRFPGPLWELEPRVWPIVERCAGTRVTLVPPLD